MQQADIIRQIYSQDIGNEAIFAPMSTKLEILSPFDGQKVGTVPVATAADVDKTVQLAHKTFRDWACRRTPFERYQLLDHLADLIEREQEPLARLISQESGKVIRESRIEVGRGIQITRMGAEQARHTGGELYSCDVTSRQTGLTAQVHRVPLGVIAAITPFNFPLSTVMHKIIPALATGNSIVLKPAPATPLTAVRIAELLKEAGAPDGLCSLIHGDKEPGEALVTHPLVRLVSFTGSVPVGKKIASLATMKRITLELGGSDPMIVFDDADLHHAVKIAIEQRFGTAGQRCNAVKRLFVHKQIAADFIVMLVGRVKALRGGDPLDEKSDYGPLIRESAAIELETRINQAVKNGARLLCGGKRTKNFLEPTVLVNVAENDSLMQQETFGPVLPIAEFDAADGLDDLIRRANGTSYGLQASLFTQRLDVIKRLFRDLETGTLNVNEGPSLRIDTLPFGGVKDSGLGREGIYAAMREMTEEKVLAL